MPVEVAMNTPLAEALQHEIQPKLAEYGWAPSDASDTTMAEYVILMIVNGKTEDEIASELSSDLLALSPEDNSAREFAKWLFQTIDTQNARLNGPSQPASTTSPDDAGDMEMDLSGGDNGDHSAPTGPKAMRNGAGGFRGGRDKRVIGQINSAMDRSNDAVLHRIRGQGGAADRINTHARGGRGGIGGAGGGPGAYGGPGRQPRNMNGRMAAGFNHALAQTGLAVGPPGMPWMGGGGGGPGRPPMQPGPMDVYAMLEQQSRMMQQMQEQMQQQMMQQQKMGQFNNRRGGGRPLSERVQRPHPGSYNKNPRNGQHDLVLDDGNGSGSGGDGQKQQQDSSHEIDMVLSDDPPTAARRDPSNMAETMCKFNLHCTNKDCKFAHQTPAAPPGVIVDVHEVCSFGAACKNKKCTGRHPSPAARAAHQSEMDCKFFPNCTNPHCLFRHPAMPLCRNGGDCSVRNCKFTHIQTKCKFHPCTNRYCTFKHEEGQRGTFPDKVWTADGSHNNSHNGSAHGGNDNDSNTNGKDRPHISERKFVDESAPEETILPNADTAVEHAEHAEHAAPAESAESADRDMAIQEAVIS